MCLHRCEQVLCKKIGGKEEEKVSAKFSKNIIKGSHCRKGREITSVASYWPCLSRIGASSVEWLKKAEDSPDLPQIIQLVNSRIELLIS
jgi:hypothetical protein